MLCYLKETKWQQILVRMQGKEILIYGWRIRNGRQCRYSSNSNTSFMCSSDVIRSHTPLGL